MKQFDFSQLGGMPWTQDRWDTLQQAYTEACEALAAIGANATANTATIMYGMQASVAGGNTTLSAGWFVYNGEMIRFPSQTVATSGAGNALYVVVTRTAADTPQPYANSTTPAVIEDVTGVLTVLANSTATDATHFQVSAMATWSTKDPAVYAAIANINNTLAALEANWNTSAGAPAVDSGTGTFTGGTVTYNSSKYINGNCILWQLQLTGWTVTGTVNSLRAVLPGYVSIGGGGWANDGAIFTGTINFGGALYTIRGTLSNVGAPSVILTYEYGAFPTGGGANINISIMAEVE